MTNPTDDDLQELAGEYVLGTLSAERRRHVEQAMLHDPDLRRAVQSWEERLLPLTNLVSPVAPSAQLWARIEDRIEGRTQANHARSQAYSGSRLAQWWNNLNVWRGLAAGGFAASMVLALMVVTSAPETQIPQAPQYMVVLAAPGNMSPGWVMQASDTRSIRLIPLSDTEVPPQKSLQLWTKADQWAGPVSLGLVKPGEPLQVALDKLPPIEPNQLFEITLEPREGSPLDRPTGPILYIGRAVKMS